MSKIILINTSYKVEDSKFKTNKNLYPPLGLLCIATSLTDAGFEVVLIDPQVENDYIKKLDYEMQNEPIFVGMTTFMGDNIINLLKICNHIKNKSPNLPIVWEDH